MFCSIVAAVFEGIPPANHRGLVQKRASEAGGVFVQGFQ